MIYDYNSELFNVLFTEEELSDENKRKKEREISTEFYAGCDVSLFLFSSVLSLKNIC